MNLNENTYSYIHQVADQIEGLTCALIGFIENTGSYLESYHFEAFNKFSNEIRNMEISVSEEIKNEFVHIKEAIEESALEIRASDSSVSYLRTQLSETEDVFSRLVIHSQNIREINSDTSNPYVPDASEEVYRAFSGYNTLLDQYQVNVPDEDDPICTLMYSFYCTVNSLFDKLFHEYDSLLQDFGVNIEKKRYIAKIAVKRRKTEKEVIKAGGKASVRTACALCGKKNVFDVAESVIGLVDKVNERLEEGDKLRDTEPKKSRARKVIKGIAIYNDALELVDGFGEIPTFEKLVIATIVMVYGEKEYKEWKESGKLDIIIAGVKTTRGFTKLGFGIVTGKPYAIIKGIVDSGANGLDLVKKTAKYMHKNDIHIKLKAVDDILHNLGTELTEYEKKEVQYEVDKEKKKLAAKKPKAPPFIMANGVFEALQYGLELYDDISAPVRYKSSLYGSGGVGHGAW